MSDEIKNLIAAIGPDARPTGRLRLLKSARAARPLV